MYLGMIGGYRYLWLAATEVGTYLGVKRYFTYLPTPPPSKFRHTGGHSGALACSDVLPSNPTELEIESLVKKMKVSPTKTA